MFICSHRIWNLIISYQTERSAPWPIEITPSKVKYYIPQLKLKITDVFMGVGWRSGLKLEHYQFIVLDSSCSHTVNMNNASVFFPWQPYGQNWIKKFQILCVNMCFSQTSIWLNTFTPPSSFFLLLQQFYNLFADVIVGLKDWKRCVVFNHENTFEDL